MLTVPGVQRVYLACGPTDLRKSIDALAALVQESFGLDPFSPSLFVFCNRERNKLKILYWEHNGFWLFYRCLERGTFSGPPAAKEPSPSPAANFAGYSTDLNSVSARHTRKSSPKPSFNAKVRIFAISCSRRKGCGGELQGMEYRAANPSTIEELSRQNARLEQQVAELSAKLKWYEEQFRLAQKKRFGASSRRRIRIRWN